jgi:hypothetical protein
MSRSSRLFFVGVAVCAGFVCSIPGIASPAHAAPSLQPAAPEQMLAGPTITFWYGDRQSFKKIGTPQRWINILGNVSSANGINGLSYTLNGGAAVQMGWGPDDHRLAAAGDFNIDLLISSLKVLPDSNRVIVTAEDGASVVSRDTVVVRVVNGGTWPTTYNVSWKGAASLTDSAQVVDGRWMRDATGLNVVEAGYDRLVAIGDTTWQDYEVTVPITVHSLDPSGYNPISGYPSVGILMRWAGHTNDPIFIPPINQPKSGYNPFGAIAYYSWRENGQERLEMFGNGATLVAEDISGKKLILDAEAMFKVRVRNTPSGPFYSFKVWSSAEAEPTSWDLSYQGHTTDPLRGSFMLVAHHVYATFGKVTVVPVAPDNTPPTISNLNAYPGPTAVNIQWTTSEPTTSVVEFGSNSSYGSTVSSPALVLDHKTTLVGLPENTLVHYRVTSIDGGANSVSSTDRTFTTTSAPKVISDDFNGPNLNTQLWTLVNPFGDGQLAMTGTQVSLQIPAGTPHDAWTGANNTVRLMQPIQDSDFELEAKFSGPMTTEFQISGILVEQDAQNYVRFDFNSDGVNTRVFAATIIANVATAVTGFSDVIGSNGIVPLYMKVVKVRNNFQLYYSLDGNTWTLETDFSAPILPASVGVFAGTSGSTPPQFTAIVDYFKGNLPVAPTLLRPANAAVDQSTTVQLGWNVYAPSSFYNLQISQDSTFSGAMAVNDSSITDTTKNASGLVLDRTYYWRVKAKLGSVASAFSSPRRFTTVVGPPTTPVLAGPSNGQGNVPVPSVLIWRRASYASSYRVQVGTDSTFSGGIVLNDSTITDTTTSAAGLAYETRYFWRVNAKGAGGTSSFAVPWSFTTVQAPPAAPVLVAPSDGAGSQPIPVNLTWRKVPNAQNYQVQVSSNPSFASGIVVNDSTITDTTRSVASVQPLLTYYWRVRAAGAGGKGSYSAIRSFTTQVGAPAIVNPADNSTGQPTSITFQWRKVASAIRYWLQLAADSAFTSFIRNDTTITDSSRFVAGLTINTRYYWRIAARDPAGWGPFSGRATFLTGTPLADQVILVSPTHQQLIFADTVRLVWRKSQPLVNRYWMEIAGDSLFSFKVADSTLTDTTTIRRQLVLNQSYYWRIRAGNPGGWGPFSETRRFFYSPPLSVAGTRGLPTVFTLEQNYPNPFNPTTTIEFAVPHEARVRIEVFNLLGQTVAIPVDGMRTAGFHRVVFEASALPSGLYLYRLTSDGVTMLKKMTLVR